MTLIAIFLSFISVGWTGFTFTAISLPLAVSLAETGENGKSKGQREKRKFWNSPSLIFHLKAVVF
jgi:hypothetical protein